MKGELIRLIRWTVQALFTGAFVGYFIYHLEMDSVPVRAWIIGGAGMLALLDAVIEPLVKLRRLK